MITLLKQSKKVMKFDSYNIQSDIMIFYKFMIQVNSHEKIQL